MFVQACNMCESTNVHFNIGAEKFICDTCGQHMNADEAACKAIGIDMRGKLIKALLGCLLLIISLTGFSQWFSPFPGIRISVTVAGDSSLYMQADTLVVDSSRLKYVKVKGGIGDSWANAFKGNLNMDSLIAANTHYIHDTVLTKLPIGDVLSFDDFKRLYPTWNSSKSLYKMGKDVYAVVNGDSLHYKPIMWNMMLYNDSKGYVFIDTAKRSNVHVHAIPIGNGGVIQLPDMPTPKSKTTARIQKVYAYPAHIKTNK